MPKAGRERALLAVFCNQGKNVERNTRVADGNPASRSHFLRRDASPRSRSDIPRWLRHLLSEQTVATCQATRKPLPRSEKRLPSHSKKFPPSTKINISGRTAKRDPASPGALSNEWHRPPRSGTPENNEREPRIGLPLYFFTLVGSPAPDRAIAPPRQPRTISAPGGWSPCRERPPRV